MAEDRELTPEEALAFLLSDVPPPADPGLPDGPITLDGARAALARVVSLERQAAEARLLESDHARHQAAVATLDAAATFPGFSAVGYRGPADPLPPRDQAEARLATQHAERAVLRLAEVDHPDRGTLFVGYLTSTMGGPDGAPFPEAQQRLVVGDTEGGLRIVARAGRCPCARAGREACGDCEGGWRPSGGIPVDTTHERIVWEAADDSPAA